MRKYFLLYINKSVLSNFAKFTRKHLCHSLFFNKVAGLRLWKERLWRRCFHAKFFEVSKNTYFIERNTTGWLLLSLWEDRIFQYEAAFSIKLYQPEEYYSGSTLGKKNDQLFLCSVVNISNFERQILFSVYFHVACTVLYFRAVISMFLFFLLLIALQSKCS